MCHVAQSGATAYMLNRLAQVRCHSATCLLPTACNAALACSRRSSSHVSNEHSCEQICALLSHTAVLFLF